MNRRLAVDARSSQPNRDFEAADRRQLFWLRLAFATFWIAIAALMVVAAK